MNLPSGNKYRVPVISTSRGMGKTFLLKKIGFHREDGIDIPCIKEAGKVGRIISVSCPLLCLLLMDNTNLKNYFWHAALLYHSCFLFQGCTVSAIPFHALSLKFICSMLCGLEKNLDLNDPLNRWLHDMSMTELRALVLKFKNLQTMHLVSPVISCPYFLLMRSKKLQGSQPT